MRGQACSKWLRSHSGMLSVGYPCAAGLPVLPQVCARLGLVSLGYLWHQPQEQLLADMIANDIEAVLVKVRPRCLWHA